jgi:hypothetical protein
MGQEYDKKEVFVCNTIMKVLSHLGVRSGELKNKVTGIENSFDAKISKNM